VNFGASRVSVSLVFNADPAQAERFWLTTDYLPRFVELIPAAYRRPGAWQTELQQMLGAVRLMAAPIPHDCTDGFYGAFWRHPAAHLDADVRAAISVFSALAPEEVDRGAQALGADLRSGAWHAHHRGLLERQELNLGYYVVVAELH
jgi:hypothetical protein